MFGMSVSGVPDIIAKMDDLKYRKYMQVYDATKEITESCYEDTHDTVAVDTGELQDSGNWWVEENAKGAGIEVAGYVEYGTDHCFYVEFGTSKMAAQPFLVPAWLRHIDWYFASMEAIAVS